MLTIWKLEIRTHAQVPYCFTDFTTPFNLLLQVGLTASLLTSKESSLTCSSKILEYHISYYKEKD